MTISLALALPVAAATWTAPQGEALARLERTLKPFDEQYDPARKMVRKPFHSPGYHTKLEGGFVHPTRDALQYALGLLDTGTPDRLERAVEILRRVVALQDSNPDSRTFGIWSWFLEEPLATMSQPDFNWADFCGSLLVQVYRDHRTRLPADVSQEIKEAILRACAVIKKRNVSPGYTNIALMGAYVTLVGGEQLHAEEYRDYGLERLARLHTYTQQNGGSLEEYNSPAYTPIAIEELSRLKAHVITSSAHPMIDYLLQRAWEELATHFHAPTRQWAGPYSRAYDSLLSSSTLYLIQRASGGRVNFGVEVNTLDETRLPLACPDALIAHFTSLSAPRSMAECFIKRSDTVGVTYLHPDYALGTINHGDLWNQRRALLMHWGNEKKPGYVQLRFLKDNYDFASAQLLSAQHEKTVLGAVNFVTDGGDTHITLNKVKDAKFRAKDLRLRFELGGPASTEVVIGAPLGAGGKPVRLRLGELDVYVDILRASLDGQPGRVEIGKDARHAWLDVVLHEREEREFDLKSIRDAIVAFSFSVGMQPEVLVEENDGRLLMSHDGLSIQAVLKPQPRQYDDSIHAPLQQAGR